MKRPLLGLALIFAAGVAAGGIFSAPMWVPLLACAICLGSFFFFRERRFSAILLLTAVFFGGLFRMALDEMPPPADDISRMVGNEPSWVTVTGVIVSDPEVERIHRPSGNLGKEKEEYKIIFNLRADSVTRFGQPETTRGKLRVVVRRTSQVYAYGDHLKIRGRIQEPWAQKNFRLFDYSRWLERQDIRRIMMTPDGGMVETLARDQGNWLGAAGYKLRAKVNQTLKIGLENEPALSAVLSGMILGYREEIPDTINEEFQRTGTFHILAVSGQNLTFIAFVFIVLLRSFGVSKWRCGYVVFARAGAVLRQCGLAAGMSARFLDGRGGHCLMDPNQTFRSAQRAGAGVSGDTSLGPATDF